MVAMLKLCGVPDLETKNSDHVRLHRSYERLLLHPGYLLRKVLNHRNHNRCESRQQPIIAGSTQHSTPANICSAIEHCGHAGKVRSEKYTIIRRCRRVTTLFPNIVQDTATTENVDPEDIQEQLRTNTCSMNRTVFKFQGEDNWALIIY